MHNCFLSVDTFLTQSTLRHHSKSRKLVQLSPIYQLFIQNDSICVVSCFLVVVSSNCIFYLFPTLFFKINQNLKGRKSNMAANKPRLQRKTKIAVKNPSHCSQKSKPLHPKIQVIAAKNPSHCGQKSKMAVENPRWLPKIQDCSGKSKMAVKTPRLQPKLQDCSQKPKPLQPKIQEGTQKSKKIQPKIQDSSQKSKPLQPKSKNAAENSRWWPFSTFAFVTKATAYSDHFLWLNKWIMY